MSYKIRFLPSVWWAIKEYIKTHGPPYKLALLVFALGLPINMFIAYLAAVFVGTSYTDYTHIPKLIGGLNDIGWNENVVAMMFDLFGIWARFALISLVIVTLWYGFRYFLNRDKLARINVNDVVAMLSFVGSGFGFRMLMLFPW